MRPRHRGMVELHSRCGSEELGVISPEHVISEKRRIRI